MTTLSKSLALLVAAIAVAVGLFLLESHGDAPRDANANAKRVVAPAPGPDHGARPSPANQERSGSHAARGEAAGAAHSAVTAEPGASGTVEQQRPRHRDSGRDRASNPSSVPMSAAPPAGGERTRGSNPDQSSDVVTNDSQASNAD